jgi:hypothetical protein
VVVLAIDGASAGVQGAFKTVADVTQAIVAVGMLAGGVAVIVGLLEPTSHKRYVRSTAARFATAMGKPKASPQQA